MKPVRSVHFNDTGPARDLGGLAEVLPRLLPLQVSCGADEPSTTIGRVAGAAAFAVAGRPCLVLPSGIEPGHDPLSARQIRFADDSSVPWPFRARRVDVAVSLDRSVHGALGGPGQTVLATDQDGVPLWTKDNLGPAALYRTSLRPPDAPAGSDVGVTAGGERFFQALPLFQFLRELIGDELLSDPTLRASYIIDDPNLHWPNYGYADYREIAMSARQRNYHVAFATIPLDAWWVHAGAANIFRAHADRLSLLIHGNNHAKHELALDYSAEDCAALLTQAVARIGSLEAKSGVQVSRVMVPPHGACSGRMLAALPSHGFEGACISAGSLRTHNDGQVWTTSLGLAPSELVHGCPVLPRWAFAGTTTAMLLVAAYLGQPLVLRGHHQDLKDGLDVFCSFADTINTLGNVRWGSLADLCRLNYRQRVDGARLLLEPLATRVDIIVPEGVTTLHLRPGGFVWETLDSGPRLEGDGAELVAAVRGGQLCSFARRLPTRNTAALTPTRPTSAKLILRRILTETRDRLRVA